jgi:hypothetical protein
MRTDETFGGLKVYIIDDRSNTLELPEGRAILRKVTKNQALEFHLVNVRVFKEKLPLILKLDHVVCTPDDQDKLARRPVEYRRKMLLEGLMHPYLKRLNLGFTDTVCLLKELGFRSIDHDINLRTMTRKVYNETEKVWTDKPVIP